MGPHSAASAAVAGRNVSAMSPFLLSTGSSSKRLRCPHAPKAVIRSGSNSYRRSFHLLTEFRFWKKRGHAVPESPRFGQRQVVDSLLPLNHAFSSSRAEPDKAAPHRSIPEKSFCRSNNFQSSWAKSVPGLCIVTARQPPTSMARLPRSSKNCTVLGLGAFAERKLGRNDRPATGICAT